MPLILGLLILKIALVFYGGFTSQQPLNTPPLLSLSPLKKHYNADLFYRIHTLELEHLGDLNGERRSLHTYNPQDLQQWFKSIEALSSKPNLLPFLVTFYYGSAPSLRSICITFLEHHCDSNPQHKWRWLAHGLTLSQNPQERGRLAQKLSLYGKQYNLPLWVKEAKARHLENQGDIKGAQLLFQAILQDKNNSLSREERSFLKSFSIMPKKSFLKGHF